MSDQITLTEALTFIANADRQQLDQIRSAHAVRDTALKQIAAASLAPGTKVSISGISPKYLTGLTGAVETIKGARADVRLDEDSTRALRRLDRKGRFYMAPDTTQYVLQGLPLVTVTPV